jgi:integrase
MARRTKKQQTPRELFTADGKRKYLTADERAAFLIKAAQEHPRGEVRSLCEVLAFTGCRISEALELRPASIDLSAKAITFRTLKQRDKAAHRAVPVPESLIDMIRSTWFMASERRVGAKARPLAQRFGRGAAFTPTGTLSLSWLKPGLKALTRAPRACGTVSESSPPPRPETRALCKNGLATAISRRPLFTWTP